MLRYICVMMALLMASSCSINSAKSLFKFAIPQDSGYYVNPNQNFNDNSTPSPDFATKAGKNPDAKAEEGAEDMPIK